MNEVLKNKNFLLIIMGKIISLAGTAIYQSGIVWFVLKNYGTNSGIILGWMMVVAIIPTAITGRWLGALTDKLNKKWLMIIADLLAAIVMLVLVSSLEKNISILMILFIATALMPVLSTIISLSVNSLISQMFKSKTIYSANSINQSADRLTQLMGLAIGSGLTATIGIKNVLIINAMSFVISAVASTLMNYTKVKTVPSLIEGTVKSFKISEFIKEHKSLCLHVLLFTVANVLWDPLLNVAFPFDLINVVNLTPWQFGLLQAMLPLGFSVGAIFFSYRPTILQKKGITFKAILYLNTIVIFLIIPFLGHIFVYYKAISVIWFGVIVICLGVCSAAINISMSVKMQTEIPKSLMGEVTGIIKSLTSSLVPAGAAVCGILVGRISFVAMILTSSIILFILIYVLNRMLKVLPDSKVEEVIANSTEAY